MRYWLRHSLPVIIVIYNPESKECYWEHVTRKTAQQTKRDWEILIPRRKRLDESSKDTLEEIAEGPLQIMRLQHLTLQEPWMTLLSDGRGTRSRAAVVIMRLTRRFTPTACSSGASTQMQSWIIITILAAFLRRRKIRSSLNIAVLIRSASICCGHVARKLRSAALLG